MRQGAASVSSRTATRRDGEAARPARLDCGICARCRKHVRRAAPAARPYHGRPTKRAACMDANDLSQRGLADDDSGRVAATAYFGPGAGPSPNKRGRLRNPAQVLVRLCDRGRRSGLGEQRSSLTCSADCATSEATSTAAGDREGVDSPLQPTSSTVTASNDSGWLPPAGRRAPSSRRGPRSPTNPAGRPGTLRPAALIDPTRAAGGTCHLVGTQVTRWPLSRRARQGGARLLRRLQREGTVTPLAAAEQSRSPALDFAGIRITPRRGHGVRGSGGG